VLSSRSRHVVLLAAIVVLGVSLRTLGLRLGLPYGHHWDEGWVIDSVIHMLVTQSGTPATYQYGAPLMLLGVDVYAVFTWLVHDVSPTDGTTLRWMVRGVSVAISSSGIVAVYLAARWGDWDAKRSARAGLFAALLYAVAAQLVIHGRFAVTDASLVALTGWTLALTARYLRTRRLGWGAAAIVMAGLAFAFKVTALPTAVIPVAALAVAAPHAADARGRFAHRVLLLAAVPLVAATFLVENPLIVSRDHWKDAFGDVIGRALQTHDGGFPEYTLREPGLPHLGAALGELATLSLHRSPAIAVALAVVAVVGLGRAVCRVNVFYAIASFHALVAVLAMALPNRAFLLRNYLVVVPALCLGFGMAASELTAILARRAPPTRARAWFLWAPLGMAVLITLVAFPLHDAIACQRQSVDPRKRAMDWIASRSTPGTRVAFAPTVLGSAAIARYDGFDATLKEPGFELLPEVSSCNDVLGSGAQYVVTASTRNTTSKADYEEKWLFQQCPPYNEVARFEPNPYEYDFAVSPDWNGRVTAIVLARGPLTQR
jgi:Dolichyl-phosphate-mannose-protein mannosyltransferase